MFSKKRLLVAAAIIFAGSFVTANAQDPACPYTLASLKGTYSIIGVYGASIGTAFGTRTLDGNGNLTGSFVVNQPTSGSTTGARTIVTGTQKGTYTVNCDGTGVITRILTLADGTTSLGFDDFIITQAIKFPGGPPIATAIVDAQRTPSTIVPGGIFLVRTYTRLPDFNPYGN